MEISFDPAKRDATLQERKIAFEEARIVFEGRTLIFEDNRRDYGERRMICVGLLHGRMVIVGYVQRGTVRHVFTMRKANEREIAKYSHRLEST